MKKTRFSSYFVTSSLFCSIVRFCIRNVFRAIYNCPGLEQKRTKLLAFWKLNVKHINAFKFSFFIIQLLVSEVYYILGFLRLYTTTVYYTTKAKHSR